MRIVAVPGVEAAPASRLPLDTLAAAAAKVFPKGRLSDVTVKSDPAAAVAVSFGKEAGSAYVNPYTGEILGKGSRLHAALHSLEEWHRWLGSRKIGKPITGAASLFFFFLLLSGLWLWFPRRWTWSAFRSAARPDAGLKGKARDWNWHTTVGFWAAPLLLVTTLTGAIISYKWAEGLLYAATGNPAPSRPPAEAQAAKYGKDDVAGKPALTPVPALEPLFAAAQSRMPGWKSITLRFPPKPGGKITATLLEPGLTGAFSRSQMTLDPATAEILKWEPFSGQNTGRKLRAWVVPVHTGRAGGPAGQLLAFLSAAAAALLVWTGFSLAIRRIRKLRGTGAPAPSRNDSPRSIPESASS
jgi:uncharacterized iron-regulated membrane protein